MPEQRSTKPTEIKTSIVCRSNPIPHSIISAKFRNIHVHTRNHHRLASLGTEHFLSFNRAHLYLQCLYWGILGTWYKYCLPWMTLSVITDTNRQTLLSERSANYILANFASELSRWDVSESDSAAASVLEQRCCSDAPAVLWCSCEAASMLQRSSRLLQCGCAAEVRCDAARLCCTISGLGYS